MGPLEMFLSWQAVTVAAIASPLTQLVKTVIDLTMTKDRRQGSRWLNRVAFPGLPVVFGALTAAFVPIRPDVLVEYVASSVDPGTMTTVAYAAWGAACGQFASTMFDRLRDFVRHE